MSEERFYLATHYHVEEKCYCITSSFLRFMWLFRLNEIAFRNFSLRPRSRDPASEIRSSSFCFPSSIVPSQFPVILSCHRQNLHAQEKRTLGPYNCSETHVFFSWIYIWASIYLIINTKRNGYFISDIYYSADILNFYEAPSVFYGRNILSRVK